MYRWVEGEAAELARRGIAQVIRGPGMRRFMYGQGPQEDRKPGEELDDVDVWQRADSVPQAWSGIVGAKGGTLAWRPAP